MSFLFPRRKLFFAGTRFFSAEAGICACGRARFSVESPSHFRISDYRNGILRSKENQKNPYYPMFPAIPVRGEIRSQIHHEHHD